MQLIDKQDDLPVGLLDLLKHGLQTLLKLAAVLCAGYQRAHVEREYCFVFKSLGHIAADDTLGKSLCDSGLADARLADEHGVILRLTRKDADDISYLGIAADNGVELIAARTLDKVGAVFFKRVIGVFGIIAREGAFFDLRQLLGEFCLGYAVAVKNALYRRRGRGKNADHDVLDGKILIAQTLCRFLGGVHNAIGFAREVDLIVAGDLGHALDRRVKLGEHRIAVNAHLSQQRRDKAAVLINEGIQQMLGGNILIVVFHRHGFGGLDHFKCLLGEVLCIHKNTFFFFKLDQNICSP